MSTYKKIAVVERISDLGKALKVVEAPMPTEIPAGKILLRIKYAGVNATDMNAILKGSYGGAAVPHNLGLEALATVVKCGEDCDKVNPLCKEGAVCLALGALGFFGEYHLVDAATCIFIPGLTTDPTFLTLPISALTAAIAIGELAGPRLNQILAGNRRPVALVTAAAGGTGQFAVQYLKIKYGAQVIGTAGGADKCAFLKSIGCDIAFDYKAPGASLDALIRKEAPDGLDCVYESVGGQMFEDALNHIAVRGQLIVIGSISGYQTGTAFSRPKDAAPIQGQLLFKSAALHGFFLSHYKAEFPKYLLELMGYMSEKKLECHVDSKTFEGVESVPDAIAHLHAGASFGKVVVHVNAK